MPSKDPIEHVIVLMLENRSFDHFLADTPKMKAKYAPNGSNRYGGRKYAQQPDAARRVPNDLMHDTMDVLVQINNGNAGFVENYARHYPKAQPAEIAEVMRYQTYGDNLKAIHKLADEFLICDNWFASVPGPTWANRLFALSGTSLGRVKMPNGIMSLNLHWYDQPTIFDRLNEKGISWQVYYGDTPLSMLFVHQWSPENAFRHHHMMQFFKDVAQHGDVASGGQGKEFPSFAFIEPAYLNPGANDAHPPHDVVDCDALVAQVYNALRANDALWKSTLLVLLCDEHGGFYDHVTPPDAIPPDHHQDEYSFDRYGVRVPAILVSPYVKNDVFSEGPLDHTSLLRYLQEKWDLGDLGERTAKAMSLDNAIGQTQPTARVSRVERNTTPAPPMAASFVERGALSDHQSAILAMSHNLETMTDENTDTVAGRSRQLLSGPQSQIDVAVDRVDSFIAQQKIKFQERMKG